MMAITHACIATAGVSLILGTADPLPLALAVLASQLPDLDTTTSIVGQVCFPLSSWLEDRFPHRSVTHSLLATAAIAAVVLPLGAALGAVKTAAALPLGHALASFSDCFTKQGVQLFWPEPAWCVSVSNPRRRLRTGGPGEYWVLATAIALLLGGIWLAGSGGITQSVGQNLGLRNTALQTYNQAAATNQVYANIQGVWASDRTRADGRYLILDAAGDEFIVTDGDGIYQTGEQILVDQLKTEIGAPVQTETQTLTFDDQDAIAPLQQLQALYPDADIYLSGSITVDFPEEVTIPVSGRQMQTAALSDSTVTMAYHPLELALLQLRDQYATGTLSARIVRSDGAAFHKR
ncbi:MAG: metal-dependent hydrolase [Leptolyngbya sp. SIO4C1]|nr:metal-dependent hydrolase [Leptolyngbya sp. SIO4C1]